MINKANMKIQTYQLTMVTPTFVGGGEESNINKSQYIYDRKNKRVIVIDERKWAALLNRIGLMPSYVAFATQLKRSDTLIQWLERNRSPRLNVSKPYQFMRQYAKYTMQVGNVDNQLNDINRFIRTGGQPYIPGSSLKGALKTALLVFAMNEGIVDSKNYWNRIRRAATGDYRPNKKELNRIISELEEEVFEGKLQGFSVSDSSTFKNEQLVLLAKRDLVIGKERKIVDLPIYREYTQPNTSCSLTIGIDLCKVPDWMKQEQLLQKAIEAQEELLIGQQGVFRAFGDIDEFIPRTENANPYFFMGGGAGFHTKTLIAALAPNNQQLIDVTKKIIHRGTRNGVTNHNNDRKVSPRTLKCAQYEGRDLMVGLCTLNEA